jgi:phosphatidate phosphatase APP1
MADWKKAIATIATNVEERFDQAKYALQERLGLGKLLIMPYLGHGTPHDLYLKGRVLRDKGITPATDNDTVWTNLVNMYKRFESDEIPHAVIRAQFGNIQQEVIADEEGYFDVHLQPENLPKSDDIWYDVDLELIDYPGKDHNPVEPVTVQAKGRVIVPPPEAQFGVISDIDDTVMRTDVLNIFSMASNTFLQNSRTRLPFEGVAAFYNALRRGTVEHAFNPIYYVSSSPWNLYDLIVDFFVVRGIPLGPLFLVDRGIDREKLIVPSHHEHKVAAIQTLLDTHPDLPFILIGDSTQKDPEIYHEIVQTNPGRIRSVYIRDVTGNRRDKQVREIITQVTDLGTDMVFVEDTLGASLHATEKGYILPEKLPEIQEERNEDKQAPTPLEQALNPKADEKAHEKAES